MECETKRGGGNVEMMIIFADRLLLRKKNL